MSSHYLRAKNKLSQTKRRINHNKNVIYQLDKELLVNICDLNLSSFVTLLIYGFG